MSVIFLIIANLLNDSSEIYFRPPRNSINQVYLFNIDHKQFRFI
jgi:hypothetical protein